MNQLEKVLNHNCSLTRKIYCKVFLGYVEINLYLEKNVQF